MSEMCKNASNKNFLKRNISGRIKLFHENKFFQIILSAILQQNKVPKMNNKSCHYLEKSWKVLYVFRMVSEESCKECMCMQDLTNNACFLNQEYPQSSEAKPPRTCYISLLSRLETIENNQLWTVVVETGKKITG